MNRRERKKKDTKMHIISCAMCLFREKGYQETVMEEIAEKTDISKGTLYNYFPEKETILVGYFQQIILEQAEELTRSMRVNDDAESRLLRLLDFIYGIFIKEIDFSMIYLGYRMRKFFEADPFDNSLRSGLERHVFEIIQEAQNNGELRKDIPAMMMARSFSITTMNLFMLYMRGRDFNNIDNTKHQLVDLFLNGAKQ